MNQKNTQTTQVKQVSKAPQVPQVSITEHIDTFINSLENGKSSELIKNSVPRWGNYNLIINSIRKFMMSLKDANSFLNDTYKKTQLVNAIHQCMQDGFKPDGMEACIIPYGSNITYIPMVKGVIKALRSQNIIIRSTHLVHKDDEFEYKIDSDRGEYFVHTPNKNVMSTFDNLNNEGDIAKKYIAVYIRYTDGETNNAGVLINKFYIMYVSEILQTRERTKKGTGTTPWDNYWGEMAIKTVIHRFAKRNLFDLEDVTQNIINNMGSSIETTATEVVDIPKLNIDTSKNDINAKKLILKTKIDVNKDKLADHEMLKKAIDNATDSDSIEEVDGLIYFQLNPEEDFFNEGAK